MKYTIITSVSNPNVREAVKIRDKKSDARRKAFLIEGPHMIEAAADSGCAINRVFFAEDLTRDRHMQTLINRLEHAGAEAYMADRHVISRLSETEAPQGIVAVASFTPPDFNELTFRKAPLLVVLEGLQDPGNIGSIIRTSDAAGADAVVILPGTCDPFMPKALRATAGSIFNIPVIFTGIDSMIERFKKAGIKLFAADRYADKDIFTSDLSLPAAFALGSEAHGVSSELRDKADAVIKIPVIGRAESLNVAAAAAVCLYEAVRQQYSMHPPQQC